jgi:hypothetical protein
MIQYRMRIPKIDELPLFPNERDIALIVVGRDRARDWPEIARTLEKRGFPLIHPLMGGRKLADVLDFFHHKPAPPGGRNFVYAPYAPDGVEDFNPPPISRGRRKA